MTDIAVTAGPFLSRESAHWDDLAAFCNASVTATRAAEELEAQHAAQGNWFAALRCARRRLLAAIALRNLDGRDDGWASLSALSAVADTLIAAALDEAHDHVASRHGALSTPEGAPARLAVLAMGKLGGGELNFSSDVDLIFVHGPAESASQGARALDAATYFARVAQRLIAQLADVTPEGIVYRVDTRLRPFGRSGPIAVSAPALEHYYEAHGRAWERYALMKARWVGQAPGWAHTLLVHLQPFVYRRYLDFGAFASLRRVKADIAADVARTTGDLDIKRGAGGIREAEFILQALQLVHGGTDTGLRHAAWRPALQAAVEAGHLSEDDGAALEAAYLFLRQFENRLQMWSDAQWHAVPNDPEIRAALATAFHQPDWAALEAQLDQHRERVHDMFEAIVGTAEDDETPDAACWQRAESAAGQQRMTDAGLEQPERIGELVRALRESDRYSDAAETRLQRIWPACLEHLSGCSEPDEVARRLLSILEALVGRTNYLALLDERPVALEHLIRLAEGSPWVVRQIVAAPGLLDELLDPRLLAEPPGRQALQTLVADAVNRAADDEARLDGLRQFQQGQMLRVAAAEISGALPLMRVSDHLSWIAEATLVQALECSRQDMVERHGELPPDAGLAIVAYGKLGGIELNYGSDLDLVFLHRGQGESDGRRSLDVTQYAIRWVQRLIHWVTTQTGAGRAYEIDTRLRPSGRSGLLVTSIQAFENYQQTQAWTWEHQALCRARVVAGDPALAEAFTAIRRETLSRPRDVDALRSAVVDMRERLRKEWLRPEPGIFDLKQSPGGMMDLEFLVQYLLLRHAPEQPAVVDWSDNVRQLDALARMGVIEAQAAEALTAAYLDIRSRMHRKVLADRKPEEPETAMVEHADCVRHHWSAWFG